MKYYKFLIILLIASMMLSACTPPEAFEKNESGDGSTSESKPFLSPEDLTVGFIYVGPINDGGYSESHDRARKKLEEDLGVNTIYEEIVADKSSFKKALESMVGEGASIIFSTSLAYEDYLEDFASKYPEVRFFQCGGSKSGANVSSYFAKVYQARYLSGIVAGLKTKSGKVGYVASFAVPEVIRGINAFTLGVKSVNKDAVVEVAWTESWYDLEKESKATESLINAGVDVITAHQDTSETFLVAEINRVDYIGYNIAATSDEAKSSLTSVYWNWDVYYKRVLSKILDGDFETESWWGDISTAVFDIADVKEGEAASIQASVDAIKELMINKKFKVFKGPILNNQGEVVVSEGDELTEVELLNMDWFVDGVTGLND